MSTAFAPTTFIDRAAVTTGRALIRWAARHEAPPVSDRAETRRRFEAESARDARERSAEQFLPFARR